MTLTRRQQKVLIVLLTCRAWPSYFNTGQWYIEGGNGYFSYRTLYVLAATGLVGLGITAVGRPIAGLTPSGVALAQLLRDME